MAAVTKTFIRTLYFCDALQWYSCKNADEITEQNVTNR